jgi:2-aminoadipate transaminase
MDKLITVKQGSDLHSNYFTQRVLHQYLIDNEIDSHIEKIKELYKKQRNVMVDSIQKYFPQEVTTTKPEGGMFLWATMPENLSSMEIFAKAYEQNVAFVPGEPFFATEAMDNTFRLNYSNSDCQSIELGIKKLGRVLKETIASVK